MSQPPAILLGGLANTTAAARALGRNGVPVHVVAPQNSAALSSKYVDPYPLPRDRRLADYLRELLLDRPAFPAGSVIFPCSDAAIAFVAENKVKLAERYRLDIQDANQQLQLLDKEKTLALAREVGVAAPRSWTVNDWQDIEAVLGDVEYPLLIKPIHSHIFQRRFRCKLFCVNDRDELIRQSKAVLDAGIGFMLCEFIPGPDDLLSSYYVYMDRDGQPMFEFTKRVLRRSPPNFGGGSYHATEWLPKTAEAGYRFFSGIGFRGLGNIEFKTDPRDGQLKVIECNARFTGAQELVTRSGLNMPYMIYDYLTRGQRPESTGFSEHMTLWLPFEDFDSFRDLRAARLLTSGKWLQSILRRQVFCYFDLDDPKPFFRATKHELVQRLRRTPRTTK
ncbi:carboxylate--amine ligase [Proteobacteria bacterium 005FR1]|nr:carboxylate--amine ligase [Proteobacteria bacterium 005FR1]